MLGQFLEFSFAAQPLVDAFELHRSLGFRPIEVGDLLSAPYVALSDGTVTIGLHDREQPGPRLTFVRPQLRGYVRGLRRIGIEIEHARLADDEFNEIVFSDPSGQSVALLEARTFAPAAREERGASVCGEFLEYSVPAASVERSRAFWEALGLTPVEQGAEPHRWLRLAGHGIVLGLHEAAFRPGISFRSDQLAARVEYLKAKGVGVRSAGAPLTERAGESATLLGAGGQPIYLVEEKAVEERGPEATAL
jgi:hypothetical protein